MGHQLKMTDINVFHKSMMDSGDSGEQLLGEITTLEQTVEQLESTFKGAGAVSYKNFMVKVDDAQKKLADALARINVGQGDLYKSYVEQEESMTSNVDQQQVDFPMA